MAKKSTTNSTRKATAPKKGTKVKKARASKKAASNKDKLKELNYIDGKKTVEQIKKLEKLVGIRETNPYGTTSLEVLEAKMADMNMWELQEFAVKVGVFPSGTRTSLKSKLCKEFEAYNKGKMRHIIMPPAKQVGDHLSPEQRSKLLDITKKGL